MQHRPTRHFRKHTFENIVSKIYFRICPAVLKIAGRTDMAAAEDKSNGCLQADNFRPDSFSDKFLNATEKHRALNKKISPSTPDPSAAIRKKKEAVGF